MYCILRVKKLYFIYFVNMRNNIKYVRWNIVIDIDVVYVIVFRYKVYNY